MWSNGTVEVTLEHDSDQFKGKNFIFLDVDGVKCVSLGMVYVSGFFMMAFDGTGSDSSPIGTFSSDLKGKGKAIDCRRDGTKVTNPIYLQGILRDYDHLSLFPTRMP